MNEFERLGGLGISESPKLLEKFGMLVRGAEKELFPGCKRVSKFKLMVYLLQLRVFMGKVINH